MAYKKYKISAVFIINIIFVMNLQSEQIVKSEPLDKAVHYLAEAMDRYHKTFDIYSDFNAPGNHFVLKTKIYDMMYDSVLCDTTKHALITKPGNFFNLLPPMDEAWSENPHSGHTCIRATFTAARCNWGGWMFLNGCMSTDTINTNKQIESECDTSYLKSRPDIAVQQPEITATWPSKMRYRDSITMPEMNTAKINGVDLRGADSLSFWARGLRGGENVSFFAFGFGWDEENLKTDTVNAESSPKQEIKISLNAEWTKYNIPIKGKSLISVKCGFGWAANSKENGDSSIVFFLDDISYNKSTLDSLHFIPSFEVNHPYKMIDRTQISASHVYDNALAIMAFLAVDSIKRAELLTNSLLYAIDNDRTFSDGRIRNGYGAGDLKLPPSWRIGDKESKSSMPGWWDLDTNKWMEDEFFATTHTGNVAWAMLAVLWMYNYKSNEKYKDAIEKMAAWIDTNCKDDTYGYKGGMSGFDSKQKKICWKATEHNIDLYPIYTYFAEITQKSIWINRQNNCYFFIVDKVWDGISKKFWTGTSATDTSINKSVVPLDIQPWSVLALKEKHPDIKNCLKWAEDSCGVGNGFDFNTDKDGIWYEGTSQMACAYAFVKNETKWRDCIREIEENQFSSGAIPSANRDNLSTGFSWKYFSRPHIGATAWYIIAKKKINPYWPDKQ